MSSGTRSAGRRRSASIASVRQAGRNELEVAERHQGIGGHLELRALSHRRASLGRLSARCSGPRGQDTEPGARPHQPQLVQPFVHVIAAGDPVHHDVALELLEDDSHLPEAQTVEAIRTPAAGCRDSCRRAGCPPTQEGATPAPARPSGRPRRVRDRSRSPWAQATRPYRAPSPARSRGSLVDHCLDLGLLEADVVLTRRRACPTRSPPPPTASPPSPSRRPSRPSGPCPRSGACGRSSSFTMKSGR